MLRLEGDFDIPILLDNVLYAFEIADITYIILADSYSLYYLHLQKPLRLAYHARQERWFTWYMNTLLKTAYTKNREEDDLTTSLPFCSTKNLNHMYGKYTRATCMTRTCDLSVP